MKHLIKELRRCYTDEQGAEKIEMILMIAAVALPILGLLLVYKDSLIDWLNETWRDTRDHESNEFQP